MAQCGMKGKARGVFCGFLPGRVIHIRRGEQRVGAGCTEGEKAGLPTPRRASNRVSDSFSTASVSRAADWCKYA